MNHVGESLSFPSFLHPPPSSPCPCDRRELQFLARINPNPKPTRWKWPHPIRCVQRNPRVWTHEAGSCDELKKHMRDILMVLAVSPLNWINPAGRTWGPRRARLTVLGAVWPVGATQFSTSFDPPPLNHSPLDPSLTVVSCQAACRLPQTATSATAGAGARPSSSSRRRLDSN